MRQRSNPILYIFIALIIISGVVLFIFKDNLADSLLRYDINGTVVNLAIPKNNELKLDVLSDSRVKPLKNYVSIFDYNDLDKSQEKILANYSKQGEIIITNLEDTGTTSVPVSKDLLRVRVGNGNPFPVKKTVVK